MALHETLSGYAAALVACVASGSFAVPIKSEAASRIDVDPLGTSHRTVVCVVYIPPFSSSVVLTNSCALF